MIPHSARARVAAICAAAIVTLSSTPAHADQIRDDQWHLQYLRLQAAHEISKGNGIIVAIIDTGVYPHRDLQENLLEGTETFPGGTGDGHTDTDSHGTGMAGLIAAHGRPSNNGAIGIAPEAKILPIRYKRTQNERDADNIAKGIEWAISNKAQVISISVGGGTSPREAAAVRTAIAANIVVVAAAGNQPQFYGITFPASLDGVVAVGATDRSGNRAEVSVKGKKMTLVAPGVDIYTTSYNNKYSKGTGTSASAAIVAGAVALIRSKYPDLSAEEVVHRLTATAVDKGPPGHDEEYGYGVLDLVAALTADVPPLPASPTASATGPTSPSPTATADQALPDAPAGTSTGTLLLVLVIVLVLAIVVALLVTRAHRRRIGSGSGGG